MKQLTTYFKVKKLHPNKSLPWIRYSVFSFPRGLNMTSSLRQALMVSLELFFHIQMCLSCHQSI